MREEDIAFKQLEDAFQKEILNNAIAKGIFGWELLYTKMNFIDRFIAKKVTKIEKDTSNILVNNINQFAEEINRHIINF
nr:flavodoxin domain-containing protein [Fervidicella metallireducens]